MKDSKYTSNILLKIFSKLFSCYFHNVVNKISSKNILEVQVSFSTRKKYCKSVDNIWSNGLKVKVQVYQTRGPRFKTIRWLKNYISLSSFAGQYNEYQRLLGIGWLKVSPHCDSAALRPYFHYFFFMFYYCSCLISVLVSLHH